MNKIQYNNNLQIKPWNAAKAIFTAASRYLFFNQAYSMY